MLVGGMVLALIIAVFEFVWKRRKILVDGNESLLWEMWKELKFAVNWNAGDTKPIRQGRSSRSRSRSMLSKSNAESLNKFGLIGVAEPDQKSAKSRKDSNYACFEENSYGESLK